jgi:two-component system NtrC family response regulator
LKKIMIDPKPKILIVDDDRTVCQSLRLLFMTQGFEVQYIMNPLNVIEFINSFKPNAVLLDLNFSVETTGDEGLKILKEIARVYTGLPVILITAWGTLDLAVMGMKIGASDFITKPWDNETLVSAVKTQLNLKQEQSQGLSKRLDNIVGKSEAIQRIKSLIANVAATDAAVLITGDSGTGKELLAETIHDVSDRSEKAFMKADIMGLENIERELLGYKRGAFSGAGSDQKGFFTQAGEGTLFLDGIENVSVATQTKLLRILEERSFEPLGAGMTEKLKCRFISSSRTSLRERIDQNRFREDLFYKLGLVNIYLPPLNERQEDIPLLASYFVEKLNQNEKKRKIEESALEWLSIQTFQGNIRELKNLVERTWLLSEGHAITIKELKRNQEVRQRKTESVMTLEEMEKSMIVKAIALKKGNMSEVAKNLGITRSALYRRMSKFGLTNPQGDED